jgi:hypothetical protein
LRASTVHSEPQPYGPWAYRSVLTGPAGPHVAYIDALTGPDGITCPRCRRARSVGIKSCEFCDENHASS